MPAPNPDNAALVAAIRAYEDGPERDRKPILRLLLAARLIVPLKEAPAPEATAFDIACPLVDRDGQRIFAAFTDREALARMDLPPGAVMYAFDAPLLCQLAEANDVAGLLLNPNGPARFGVPRDEAAALAEGRLPENSGSIFLPHGARVILDCPADRPPDAVLDELRVGLELSGVGTAYWCEMTLADGAPQLAIGLAPWSPELSERVRPLVEAIWTRHKPLSAAFSLLSLDAGLAPASPPPTGASATFRDAAKRYGEGSLLFQSGHRGYLRFVRTEDTLDAWHSFNHDPRLLPAPEPPSNETLMRALEEGFRTQSLNRTPIHAGVLGSRLLVPVHRPPEGLPIPPCLQLVIFTPQGERCLAAATDEAASRKSFPRAEYWWVALPGERLCRMVGEGRYAGLWLLGGDQPGYIMGVMECDALGRGQIPIGDGRGEVGVSGRMAFGLPAKRPPADFLDGLRRAAERGGAEEAYWTFMTIERQPVHMGLAIRPCTKELLETMGKAIKSLIIRRPEVTPYIDFLDLDRQPAFRGNGELLYRRPKPFGLWGRR
ncbi:MAG TPA: SseB family protein [Armatimonadota bacterium]|jgi:hypothetical protein